MKRIFILLVWFVSLSVFAQSVEREYGGKIVLKDAQGYIVEKRTIDRNGDFIIEAPSGRVMQIVTKDAKGNIVILNGANQVIQIVNLSPNNFPHEQHSDIDDLSDGANPISIYKDFNGVKIYERDNKVLFRVGKNFRNEKYIEDGSYKQLRLFKKDFRGNKVVEAEGFKEILKLDPDSFKQLLLRRNMSEEEWEDWMIDNFIKEKLYR